MIQRPSLIRLIRPRIRCEPTSSSRRINPPLNRANVCSPSHFDSGTKRRCIPLCSTHAQRIGFKCQRRDVCVTQLHRIKVPKSNNRPRDRKRRRISPMCNANRYVVKHPRALDSACACVCACVRARVFTRISGVLRARECRENYDRQDTFRESHCSG